MEDLEVSQLFKATSQSLPSPTAAHIACISGARLQIRCLSSLEIVRSIALPQTHDVRTSRLAWSPPSRSQLGSTPPRYEPPLRSNRILIADDENTRVYDLRDEKWSATISNGSGGMGKNVHVTFGSTEEEVMVWSDFASKVSIWCLRSGRTVEIKDPKYSGNGGKGWGFRPSAQDGKEGRGSGERGVLAILCRAAGQDIMLLLDTATHRVIKRVELPTMDAAGLKWSLDGRWIAVWDSAASGYNLHIYTADGHLYRTVTREPTDNLSEYTIEGLGIKSLEWVPGNEWLAVGGWDRRVRILSTRTFAPVVFLDHTAQINAPSASVYNEAVDSRGYRSYNLAQQPTMAPKAPVEKNDNGLKQGISVLAFNTEGTICATRDDAAPTTLWIWDLRTLRPSMILIQHAPIKSLQWHPTNPSTLLIQTAHDYPIVYIWDTPSLASSISTTSHTSSASSSAPQIINLSSSITKCAGSTQTKWDAKWLSTPADRKPSLIFGHQQGYLMLWPEGKDQILRFETQEEESDDSLYDILTGRTPIPPLDHSAGGSSGRGSYADSERLEDTFRDRRGGNQGRGESVFYESGMDEMF